MPNVIFADDAAVSGHALPEASRLAALDRYGLASTPPEPDFDHFAAIAAELLGLPIGLVTLVGHDAVTIKGRTGISIEMARRDIAPCSYTIQQDKVLSVPDLARDARFATNPLVTQKPYFRSYAGAPLVTPDGHRLGALCVIGYEPRLDLTQRERNLLSGLAALVMDRMELRRLENAYRDSKAQFARMSDAAPGAVVCANEAGVFTHWNRAAERLFGWTAAEALGQPLELIIPHAMRTAHSRGFAHRSDSPAVPFSGRVVEMPALRRDGSTFMAHVSLSRWQAGGRMEFGASIHDVSERRAAEDRLRFLAHYDPLTGLVNRARLLELMATAAVERSPAALVLLDLDGFKQVNDTLGHGAGDLLLAEVGQRFTDALPPGATLARLGGDEFAVLLLGCTRQDVLEECAHTLKESLEPPFHVGGREFPIRASTGLALAGPGGTDGLLANADLALYQAKSAGRGQCRAYTHAMREAHDARVALELEVARAVGEGAFVLHYQPQVRLHGRRLIGAEALLRWNHPVRGLLAPGAFLQALQAGPLAGAVGDWAINEACRQARLWRDQGLSLRVAVNLFAEQLRAGRLVTTVEAALQRWGLPPGALELEVTEDIALPGNSRQLDALRTLHATGVSIALDDFGTGFASLSTLKQCPLSRLKIDRSFVSGIGPDGAQRGDLAIIEAVLALAHGLGIHTVAEGIETEAQVAFLRARGCEEGQGYLFGRPAAAGPAAFAAEQAPSKRRTVRA